MPYFYVEEEVFVLFIKKTKKKKKHRVIQPALTPI